VYRATLVSIHPRTDRDATRPFREAMRQGDDALKQYIAQRFKGTSWKTDEVLKGMMDSEDFYASEIVQVKPPALYKGRFATVGDAGYAPGPTGGGTSLAIAGAYLLAGEVGKHKGDLAAGLSGYEEQMRPIIDDMQQIPPLFPGIMAPQTA
jgi:2-polyprenyl-6-methoxyphenol hydroxylase-like FAD-dependent oxidoreductase